MKARREAGSRLWLPIVCAGVAACTLFALFGGCTTGPALTEAVAVLHATLQVGAVEGKTALVSTSFTPEAPASITFPTDMLLKATEPDNSTGKSLTPILAEGGARTEAPLVISSFGTAGLTLVSTGKDDFVIADGYGHSLNIGSLAITFENKAMADTNLPAEARIVIPMRGALRSLAQLRVEGAEPGQVANLSVSISGAAALTQKATADASGVLSFLSTDTAYVDDVTSASIVFSPESTTP
jgi:hypothetical protein